jgi:hypothetical protein
MGEWLVVLGGIEIAMVIVVAGLLWRVHVRLRRRRRVAPLVVPTGRPVLRRIDGGLPLTEALGALETAADDLDKAANQFASVRASQHRGHSPQVRHDPEIFAGKAERARLVHARLSKTSPAGAVALEPRHPSRGGAKGSEDPSSAAAPAGGDHHLRGLA